MWEGGGASRRCTAEITGRLPPEDDAPRMPLRLRDVPGVETAPAARQAGIRESSHRLSLT
jgi:hypothetical protein